MNVMKFCYIAIITLFVLMNISLEYSVYFNIRIILFYFNFTRAIYKNTHKIIYNMLYFL